MSVALITHPDCLHHDMGQIYPESPARLLAINDQLIASGLDQVLFHYQAPCATREQLQRVHDTTYIQTVFDTSPKAGFVTLGPDAVMNPGTLDAALHAAGAVVLGVDLVMENKVNSAFCGVRPPGHHAGRNRPSGFCFFNNIAVGAGHAMAIHGLDRIAIADFDVHHGNGTEEIFADEDRVLFCSSFQHPFYPYTDIKTEYKNMVHVPLAAGSGSETFRKSITEKWLPALETFRPQLVLCSAGFDAHREDDMADIFLNEADYAWITRQLKVIADKHARGRIVSSLEGGYALHALGRSVAAHINALIGRQGF